MLFAEITDSLEEGKQELVDTYFVLRQPDIIGAMRHMLDASYTLADDHYEIHYYEMSDSDLKDGTFRKTYQIPASIKTIVELLEDHDFYAQIEMHFSEKTLFGGKHKIVITFKHRYELYPLRSLIIGQRGPLTVGVSAFVSSITKDRDLVSKKPPTSRIYVVPRHFLMDSQLIMGRSVLASGNVDVTNIDVREYSPLDLPVPSQSIGVSITGSREMTDDDPRQGMEPRWKEYEDKLLDVGQVRIGMFEAIVQPDYLDTLPSTYTDIRRFDGRTADDVHPSLQQHFITLLRLFENTFLVAHPFIRNFPSQRVMDITLFDEEDYFYGVSPYDIRDTRRDISILRKALKKQERFLHKMNVFYKQIQEHLKILKNIRGPRSLADRSLLQDPLFVNEAYEFQLLLQYVFTEDDEFPTAQYVQDEIRPVYSSLIRSNWQMRWAFLTAGSALFYIVFLIEYYELLEKNPHLIEEALTPPGIERERPVSIILPPTYKDTVRSFVEDVMEDMLDDVLNPVLQKEYTAVPPPSDPIQEVIDALNPVPEEEYRAVVGDEPLEEEEYFAILVPVGEEGIRTNIGPAVDYTAPPSENPPPSFANAVISLVHATMDDMLSDPRLQDLIFPEVPTVPIFPKVPTHLPEIGETRVAQLEE